MSYLSLDNQATQRKVEPYGIVAWDSHWYLVGYCCLRQDYRTFRLDRMEQVEQLGEFFERPANFDCRAYLAEHHYGTAGALHIEVEFQAALRTVQQKLPAAYGSLTATPTGTLYQGQYADVDGMARYLMSLGLPFVIHNPPELREALLRLAQQMVQIATAPS